MNLSKSNDWHLRKTIPSDRAIGSQLVEPMLEKMKLLGWPEFELIRVQLAYEEAITNAIRHGNKHAANKCVDVTLYCDENQVKIRIVDQGDGFDPDNVPDPRNDELLETGGGRGVLLIHELMSRVRYVGRGNEVIMEKDRMPSGTAED